MPLTDQGVNFERYMFIPRTLVFLTCADKVLLIKGAPTKRLWAGKYNGLGGHIEPGEDVLAAARREVQEEAGIEAADLWLAGVIAIDTNRNPGIVIFVFRGVCTSFQVSPSAEGLLEWLPQAGLESLPLVEDLPRLLPLVLSQRPAGEPFFARYAYAQDGRLSIRFSGDPA